MYLIDKSVASCSGLGRAQLLTCYVDRPVKRPGGLAQHTTTGNVLTINILTGNVIHSTVPLWL